MQSQPACTALAQGVPRRSPGWTSALAQRVQDNGGWLLAMLLLLAYTIAWGVLSPMPLQDFPTHLARAVVMDDLLFHGGTRFGDVYQYHFLLIPYLLGDLLLSCAVELFGASLAGTLWTVATFLSFPLAVLAYLRLTGFVAHHRVLLVLLSLYLASDRFFLMGFMSFRLGLAITLVILGIAERFRRHNSAAWFVAYAGAVVLGYLLHLTTAAFVVAAIGVTAVLRVWKGNARLATEAALFLPLAGVLTWNFLVADGYRTPTDLVENPYFWGTLPAKFARLASELLRFRRGIDALLVLMLAGSVLLASGRLRMGRCGKPMVLQVAGLAATFLFLYFLLPICYSDAWEVDARALPLFVFFLILTCFGLGSAEGAPHPFRTAAATALAVLLVTGNLALLVHDLAGRSAWITQYRTVIAALPVHARVFPIFTQPVGVLAPLLHANSFVTIDRAGIIPYEFAGDNGNTVRYFRYRHRPYDPPETWYAAVPPLQIDWQAVACNYDYLLITRPYATGRLPPHVRTVKQNETAALLAFERQACARGS